MAEIGRMNHLRIVDATDHGFLLEAGILGKILLPKSYADTTMDIGTEITVFLYRDSEDRLVATTETPLVQVGEFACLEVVSLHPRTGAFLNWGLRKDLLLPYREQGERTLRKGDRVVVAVFLDHQSQRIVASTRLTRHFDPEVPPFLPKQPVEVLIYGKSPLGFKAVVDRRHSGLLFRGETSGELSYGDQFTGYIKKVHSDGKIDVLRDPAGYSKTVRPLADEILEKLKSENGHLPINDKSPPETIRSTFRCSKQAFKKAIGTLYRARKIKISDGGIHLA